MRRWGARVTWLETSVIVTGPPRDSSKRKHLRAIDVKIEQMLDVAMTLAVDLKNAAIWIELRLYSRV